MWQTNASVESIVTSGGVIYAGGYFAKVRPPGTSTGSSSEVARRLPRCVQRQHRSARHNVQRHAERPRQRLGCLAERLHAVRRRSVHDGQRRVATACGCHQYPLGNAEHDLRAEPQPWCDGHHGQRIHRLPLQATSRPRRVRIRLTSPRSALPTVRSTRASPQCLLHPPASPLDTAPSAHGRALLLSPDGSRLLVGGGFATVDGQTTGGMVSMDPGTGALQSWPANNQQSINVALLGSSHGHRDGRHERLRDGRG